MPPPIPAPPTPPVTAPKSGKSIIYIGFALPFIGLLIGFSLFWLVNQTFKSGGNPGIQAGINSILFGLPVFSTLAAPIVILFGFYKHSQYKKYVTSQAASLHSSQPAINPDVSTPPSNPYL